MRLLVTVVLAGGTILGGPPDAVKENAAPLVVVGDFANPPFSSWSATKRPVGIEVEILDRVGRELGRPVEWRELPFAGLLEAVERGEAHVAASTIGITEARARRVSFSAPYFETELSVVVRTGDDRPRDLEALDGRVVGAGRGTTAADAARREMPGARLVVDREGDASFTEMLLEGKLAAVVVDRPAAERVVAENPGRLAILDQGLGAERYAFAVRPGQTEILKAIDAVLERARRDGEPAAWSARVARVSGIGLPNQRRPLDDVLSGGQPDAGQLARAAELGFRTVINLRGPGEKGEMADEERRVEQLGMRYVAIPVAGAEAINLENAKRLREVLEQQGTLPAVVHCASGNRIGAMFALQAFHLDGKPAEEAIEIGREAGLTRAEPLVRERLGLSPEKAE